MVNPQLLDYITKALEGGATIEKVSPALIGQGWNKQDIDEAAAEAARVISTKNNLPIPPKPGASPTPAPVQTSTPATQNVSASQVLLYIGGLIVVLAAVIYIGINWSSWSSGARIAAIFLPTLIAYAAGAYLWNNQKQKSGAAFFTVSAIIFPFFLIVLFRETSMFDATFSDQFNMALASVCFALYFGSSFPFKHSIWSFLYHFAGIFVLYSGLKLVGVPSVFTDATMAWLFLVIGTGYVFLGMFYDRIQESDSGRYSFNMGSILIVLSMIRLFGQSTIPGSTNLPWLFLIIAAAYFGLGMYFEKRGLAKFCEMPYFVGTATVFFSLLKLGYDGTLLTSFFDHVGQTTQDLVGWSNLVTGVIFMAIGFGLSKIRNTEYPMGSKYHRFFEVVSPLWILGSLFYLGLGGHKPVYETALLLGSLGFIFGSIPQKAGEYLVIGSIFLVIYIFSTGAEYFQNQVGWPITLFIAGLLSMGIGVLTEKIRRTYFATPKKPLVQG